MFKKNFGYLSVLFSTAVVLLIAFTAITVVGCNVAASSNSTSSASSIGSSSSAATASAYNGYNLNIFPGENGTELNITWMTTNRNGVDVQVAAASNFPAGSTLSFTGSQSALAATTNSNSFTTGEYANKATITGLVDSTTYYYRVGDGTNFSQAYAITTRNQNNYGFLAVGDPQIGAGANDAVDTTNWVKSVSNMTAAYPAASFLLSAGDEVNNESLITDQMVQYVGYYSPSQLTSLPVAAVIGNHDFSMGQYYGYHYNLPNISSNYGVSYGNDGDCWFIYGNALYILLNSNTESATTHAVFLSNAIAANPNAKWRIVSFHHSIYSEANHMTDADIIDRRATYPPIFETNHIDLVISGHDHSYTRTYQMLGGVPVPGSQSNVSVVTNPTGILYLTLDSGSGSKYYQFQAATNSVYSASRWQANVPSFSYFTINGGTLTVSTYRLDTMALIDAYSIVKN